MTWRKRLLGFFLGVKFCPRCGLFDADGMVCQCSRPAVGGFRGYHEWIGEWPRRCRYCYEYEVSSRAGCAGRPAPIPIDGLAQSGG